jgi:5-methylcytosine-specific restriction endonuclease McrA
MGMILETFRGEEDKMGRCKATKNLEVHHKRRDGGNGINNAMVLCEDCHINTSTYGTPGNSPPPFSADVKVQALKNAGHQCECRKDNCHS